MKKLLTILCCACSMSLLSASTTPAQKLINRLKKVEHSGKIIYGHHDDTSYGHTWRNEPNRSDVKEVCGDYPGIMSWDLGHIERGGEKQLDGVDLEFIKAEVVKQHQRGGINVFSWHLLNPITSGDSWDCSNKSTVMQCVTEGTTANSELKNWISIVADYLGNLKDNNGVRIPVIFRPWHEHTGSWFWWGKDECTADEYKALWKMTRTIFDAKGIDNVVWAYSPDKSNVSNESEYMERYPGDYYIDIMGADIYHFDGEKGTTTFIDRINSVLGCAVSVAKKHNKLVAFTETGLEGLTISNWWTEVLLKNISQYPICYVVTWRNASDRPDHYFAPYPGQKSSESFNQFYKNKKILFAKGLKRIK